MKKTNYNNKQFAAGGLKRMKKLMCLVSTGLLSISLTAQTVIQVGTGVVVPSVGGNPGSGANGASPYGVNVGSGSGGKHLQIIYTAAQINAALTAAGLTNGVPYIISTTSWDVSSDVGATCRNQAGTTIKMANVAQTSFVSAATPYVGASTTVFGPTAITYPAGTGYLVTNTLATSFTWDGTSSLLVEYCYTFSGVGLITTYGGCRRTNTASNQMIYNGGAAINCGTSSYVSAVAASANVKLTVTSACTQPTVLATAMNFSSLTTSSVQVNWTNGNGASRVVVAHASTAVSANPATGTNYSAGANSAFGSGTNLGSSNFVVYAGTGSSVNVTGLTPGTIYFFSVFEASATYCYSAGLSGSQAIPTCLPPSVQASGASIGTNGSTSQTINWTRGNGDAVIVVARLTATSNVSPINGTPYTANSVFGSGGSTGANNFVVYNGTGSSVTVIGLTPSTAYTYSVYEFVSASSCYAGASTIAGTTLPCQPALTDATGTVFSTITNTATTLTFTRGSGTNVMVVARLTATSNIAPAYNTSYIANTVFGSGATTGAGNYVVYNGTGNSVTVNGLANNSAYTYLVYEYNASPNCYTISPLTAAQSTLDGTTSGGCAASVVRSLTNANQASPVNDANYTSITPATNLTTTGVMNTNYTNQPIGFNFVYNGITYTSFGLNTNGYIWFGTGTPFASATNPISNASSNLGGAGTIDGIISALGTFVNSNCVYSTNGSNIGYSVTGVSPNRILTIQWRGYTGSTNCGGLCDASFYTDIARLDFQIKLNEDGGTNSDKIVLAYASEYPYCISGAAFSAQVGIRGTSNASFTNRTGGGNANWALNAGTLNTDVCSNGSNNYINGNVSVTFTQAVTAGPTINGFASGGSANNACPATTVLLTAGSGFSSYQWFLNGSIIPGPGSSASTYTATQSGSYTVVGKNGTCYAQSNAFTVTISSCGVAPTFTTCPGTQTANTTTLCSVVKNYSTAATGVPAPTITYSFSGSTTGSGSGDGSGSAFNVGTTAVTVTATNASGTVNCNFNVVVTDATPPTITCPSDVTAACGDQHPSLGTPVTNDNCGVASTTNNAPATFPFGTTVVTWTVTDVHGLTATCNQSVLVKPNPVGSSSGNQTICNGSATSVSLTSSITGTTFVWGSAVLSGTVIGNNPCSGGCGTNISDVLTLVTSSSGVVEYTVTPTSPAGCAGTTYPIDVTVNYPSTAPATLNGATTLCGGSSTTISQSGGVLGSGAHWQWYTNPTYTTTVGGALTSANAGLLVSPGVTTTYYLRIEGTGSPCTATVTGPAGGVTVTVTNTGTWLGTTSSDWYNGSNWCGGVPTSGTNVTISSGAPFMPVDTAGGAVCNNITLGTGASLTMNGFGDLTASGNWTNNGTFTPGGGIVTLAGSSSQSITGATTFFTLDINNTSNVTLNNDITISSVLQFDAGNIQTGSHRVTVDTNGLSIPIAGFVEGNLRQYIPSGLGYGLTYTVGTGSDYTPLDLFVDSVSTAGYITVKTTATDQPNIATSAFNAGKTVNRYWTITNGGVVVDEYTAGLAYVSTDKDPAFIENYGEMAIYSGASWTLLPSGVNTGNYQSASGITTFGDLQIGQFNPVPGLYTLSPNSGSQSTTINVVFNGANFISGATVNVGTGITVNTVTVNNDSTITANISISPTAPLGAQNFSVTNPSPGGGISDLVSFTVVPLLPTANFIATNLTIPCNLDGSTDFNNTSSNATSYSWNFGAGAVPATSTSTGTVTVSYTTTGMKTISLIATNAYGSDTLTITNYITVSANPPSTAGTITGPVALCVLGGTIQQYHCNIVSGAISYNWTVPTGANILSGQGTTNISVSIPTGTFIGNIAVYPGNSCGNGPTSQLGVSSSAPTTPTTITGPPVVCGMTTAFYSVSPVPGAGTYNWTVPGGVTGMTIAGGQGTTMIHVSVSAGTVTGYVTVQAMSICGNSGIDSLYVTKKPASPAAIFGPTSVCGTTTATYSIADVPGASSYGWVVPAGMTITSGATTTSINVNITSFVYGQVKATAYNACGNLPGTSITVYDGATTPPVTMTGPTNVCGLTTADYTCTGVASATSYTWTPPSGITINSGQGTTHINVSFSGYTSGSLTVASTNPCGTGTARALALTRASITPGAITGPANVCGMSTATYSIATVAGATGYTWVPATGMTITAGQGTTQINVNLAASTGTVTATGTLKVLSTNSCAVNSAYKTIVITRCLSPIAMNNAQDATDNAFSGLYPNPTSAEFKIDVSSDTDKEITVMVYDVLGNLVISEKHLLLSGTGTLTTSIENYKAGIYFVRLVDADNKAIYSQTLVKQ